MFADLHAHYPMQVVTDVDGRSAVDGMTRVRGRATTADRARAFVLKSASMLFSDRDWWSGYRITVPGLREGQVGVVLSVLYRPFEEVDLQVPYGSPPRADYFAGLMRDLQLVEAHVAALDPAQIRIAHDRRELDQALADGATALVHCVEGGFHLGATVEEVRSNVAELARHGVAYVTLAHLFHRGVAANTPALPFLPDGLYDRLFPQKPDAGLSDLGQAAVRAMARERILVDVSHMRADALEAALRILDDEDPEGQVPVIASHAGYRHGSQTYMLDDDTIRRIARRGGAVGLIMAQHQLNDGVRRRRCRTFPQSFQVIRRHIDRIHEITGSHDHVAVGSDFDGFIKPTMSGLDSVQDLARLERWLVAAYGAETAAKITAGNAVRVLRAVLPVRR